MSTQQGQAPEERDSLRRKSFLKFGPEDQEVLSKLSEFTENQVDRIIDGLYDHILSFPETLEFFPNDAIIARVKAAQREYFLGLTGGDYGNQYFQRRREIGENHNRIGLDPEWYLGGYSYYFSDVISLLSKEPKQTLDGLSAQVSAFAKVMFLDMGLAIDAYISAKEEVVESQRASILEMSTPVLSLWEGILVAPIIGTMDTQRAQQVMETLLEMIVKTESTVAILDVTGLPLVDTQVAANIIDITRAARMLGAQVILTGINPALAQTLTRLQVDLTEVITRGTLSAGLAEAFTQRELQVRTRTGTPSENHAVETGVPD